MSDPADSPQIDRFEPENQALTTGLESCGLAVADTAAVLAELAVHGSLEDVSRQIAQGTLLTKRSANGRKHFLTAFRKRYLKPQRPLPAASVLAAALRAVAPPAQSQILLPYVLLADRAAYEASVAWFLPRRATAQRLRSSDVVEELDKLFAARSQRPWTSGVKRRWAEGLLSVLRDVGAVGRGELSDRCLPYLVRPEALGFHLRGLYDTGFRGPALVGSDFWRLMLLTAVEARQSVRAVVERGWWRYKNVGGVEELVPSAKSIEDWIAHELG